MIEKDDNMKKRYLIVVLFILTAPAALYSSEFLNTVVHLNFGIMSSFATGGDIIDSEKNAIESPTGITDNSNISHYETAGCATLDIVPTSPLILGMEEHALKFGLRGSYRFHYLNQRVTTTVEEIGNRVMDYKSWMVGPIVYYAPFIGPSDLNMDYTASGGFTFYALYGQINGNMTAYPSMRDKGIKISASDGPSLFNNGTADYDSKISGSKFDFGVGAEFSLCSINVGVNIYYTYINVDMKDKLYVDLGRNGHIKEGCLELYIGIPIETFIEPIIPTF